MTIAILGATSHIAKGLILGLLATGDQDLFLFARSPELVRQFLLSIDAADDPSIRIKPFSEFGKDEYEAVINCVGIGSPAKLQNELLSIFEITENFDNLVLTYIKHHTHTLYISLSSGAAYGTQFTAPADAATQCSFDINCLQASEYYGIAKVYSEAKHRALKNLSIVDLRVFGYFSRFIDLKEKFLLSEIVACLQNGRELVTGTANIVRDYVGHHDLLSLIKSCMAQLHINDVFDVYSAKPATKFEIIKHFALHHGLRYRIEDNYAAHNVTGSKDHYYSKNRKAFSIGYNPAFSSIEAIDSEVGYLLGGIEVETAKPMICCNNQQTKSGNRCAS